MIETLAFPAFVAGLLTFLAPCTLPLIPGYLTFISGVSIHDFYKNEQSISVLRRRVVWNGFWYVVGFSVVFIALGTAFSGIVGAGLSKYRLVLERVSGALIFLLGLYMMNIFHISFLKFLNTEKRFHFVNRIKPGKPLSSFLFGVTFAFGWTPCIGPILGSILLLASSSDQASQGAVLLGIFSLGLAIPFMLVALGIGQAISVIKHLSKYMSIISVIGGGFIALIGFFVMIGKIHLWVSFFNSIFSFINYEGLLKFF